MFLSKIKGKKKIGPSFYTNIRKERISHTPKIYVTDGFFTLYSGLYGKKAERHKESWVPTNWWFWTVVLEKTLENPADCKEIKPVNPKGNHSWIFIGITDAEAKVPILWPPDAKNWLIWKDPDAGKDWKQEEKGTTEGEMVGWHYQLNGHESEQALGVGDGQGSLACCSPWGPKELYVTEWLNWTDSGLSLTGGFSDRISHVPSLMSSWVTFPL